MSIHFGQKRPRRAPAHLPKCEPESGGHPPRSKVGERAGDGRVGGHLADRAEGGVRGRADEGVGDERAERASCLEGMTGTQEKTSAKGTRNLQVPKLDVN